MKFKMLLFCVAAAYLLHGGQARAQTELWFHVTDMKGKDQRDVRLDWAGHLSAPTSNSGKTKLDLPSSVHPGALLYIKLHAPPGMKIYYPPNARVIVPEIPDPWPVSIHRKGGKEILRDVAGLTSIAADIVQGSVPVAVEVGVSESVFTVTLRRRLALEAQAREWELPVEELSQAIASVLPNAADPLARAVGTLYIGNQKAAAALLTDSLRAPVNARGAGWRPADLRFLLGQAYFEQGEFQNAAEQFESAARAEPGSPQRVSAYGVLLFKTRRFDESLEVWNRLQLLQPNNKFVYLNKGLTLRNLNRPREAVEPFERFLNMEPAARAPGRVYKEVAVALFEAGKVEAAAQAYRQGFDALRAAGDAEGQFEAFKQIREVYVRKPEPGLALLYNQQLLLYARSIGDKRAEALLLSALAAHYAQRGENSTALEYYANSLKMAEASQSLSADELVTLIKSYEELLVKNNRMEEAGNLRNQTEAILGRAAARAKENNDYAAPLAAPAATRPRP